MISKIVARNDHEITGENGNIDGKEEEAGDQSRAPGSEVDNEKFRSERR